MHNSFGNGDLQTNEMSEEENEEKKKEKKIKVECFPTTVSCFTIC